MYLRIVAICSLVAVPVSYLLIDHWLQQFAYRAKMAVWIYLLAVVIVVVITVATVTIRAYKTANENPVDAISR